MILAFLGTAVAGLVLAFGLFYFLSIAYHTMLVNAYTPWYLKPPVGELLLYIFFKIASVSRAINPSAVDKKSIEVAKLKIEELKKEKITEQGVCFVGSSTFTYWRNMKNDFKNLENISIINSGFGGSCTHDLLPHIRELCTNYNPRVIVYFCGTNNATQGLSVEGSVADFVQFMNHAREICPSVHIIYLAVTITPFYRKYNINDCMKKGKDINEAIKFLSTTKNFCFVNTDDETNNEFAFLRNPVYFLGDNHHLNDQGHFLLGKVLLPTIQFHYMKNATKIPCAASKFNK